MKKVVYAIEYSIKSSIICTHGRYRNMAKGREFHPTKICFCFGSVIFFFIGHEERQVPPTKWPRGAAHQKWNYFYFSLMVTLVSEFFSESPIGRPQRFHLPRRTKWREKSNTYANHEMVGKTIIDERNSWYPPRSTLYVKHSCPVTLSASLGHFSAHSPSSIVLSLSLSLFHSPFWYFCIPFQTFLFYFILFFCCVCVRVIPSPLWRGYSLDIPVW